MRIKGLIDECFNDYKKPSMYIAFPSCSFKCDQLNGCQICQNSKLALEPDIEIKKEKLIERYFSNPITEAIIFSGLEPFDSMLDVVSFITTLREEYECYDDVVIYTGYTEEELEQGSYQGSEKSTVLSDLYNYLRLFPNIIVKFGRFVMNDTPHFDEVLGVNLSSHNQYARYISNDNQNKSE